MLDAATRRNLELDSSLSGNPEATLFALIDRCVTAMGSRQLRRWLNRTLTDQGQLRQRYQAIAALIDRRRFEALRQPLRGHRRCRTHPVARRAALGTTAGSGAAAQRRRAAAGTCGRGRGTGRGLTAAERAAGGHRPTRGVHALLTPGHRRKSRRRCCGKAMSSPRGTTPSWMSCAISPPTPMPSCWNWNSASASGPAFRD